MSVLPESPHDSFACGAALASDAASMGRKQRWSRIIPAVFAVNTVAFFDRVNIGMAMPNMSHDLGLSPVRAGFAAGIFFWGYIVSMFASGWVIPRLGPRRTLLMALIAWGGCAMATGLAHDYRELLIFRFLLGVAEGPVFAAPILVLSQWFLKPERARAFGLWNLAYPFAALIVGPISGVLLTFTNWHYMLILEGIPAWIVAIIWWYIIPSSLNDATWLSVSERDQLRSALSEEGARAPAANATGARWFSLLRQRSFWLLVGSLSLMNSVVFSFAFWFPTMVRSITSTGAAGYGLLSGLLYVMAIPGVLAITYSSDRLQERRIHASVSMVLLGVVLLLAANLGGSFLVLRMAVFILAGFFLFMWLPVFLTLLAETFSSPLAVAASALVGGVGNLVGGTAGPISFGWIYGHTHDFTLPLIFLAGCASLASVFMLLCRARRPGWEAPSRGQDNQQFR